MPEASQNSRLEPQGSRVKRGMSPRQTVQRRSEYVENRDLVLCSKMLCLNESKYWKTVRTQPQLGTFSNRPSIEDITI
jgi:hypothetical protein